MIASAEKLTYRQKGNSYHVVDQIYCHLSRVRDELVFAFAYQISLLYSVIGAYGVRDRVHGNHVSGDVYVVLERVLDGVEIVRAAPRKRAIVDDLVESPFKLADVGCDVLRNEEDCLLRDVVLLHVGFLLKNRNPRLDVGLCDVYRKSALKTRLEPLFQRRELTRMTVGRENDLFAELIEVVKGVEERLLASRLTGKKLDVVHHQHVDSAVLRPEFEGEIAVLERVDVVVDELFGRDVQDVRVLVMLENIVGNRVHDVSLAKPDSAVNEEGIMIFARLFGNGLRGGKRQRVVVADDKRVERVVGIEDGDNLVLRCRLFFDRVRNGKTVLFVFCDDVYARDLRSARLDRRLYRVGKLNGDLLVAVERSDKNENIVLNRVRSEIFEP